MTSLSATSNEIHAVKCELAVESLRTSSHVRLRVTGWSMLPTICPGDTLWIERTDSKTVSKGDIVLCARNDRFAVHRVVAKHEVESRITTRGDAMPQIDPPVPERDLLGKVAFIERNGKCIAPGKRMNLRSRAIAAAVRNSNLAARLFVGIHGMRQHTQIQDSCAQNLDAPASLRPSEPCQS